MRAWLMRNAFGRRLGRTTFTSAELAAMAWNPSYRAPSAMDVNEEGCEPLPTNTLEGWSARDVVFENGEAVACSLSGRAFIALGEAMQAHPWQRVGTLRLVAVQPFMVELAACPHLSRLHTLSLRGNRIGDSGAIALAASPHLMNLKHIDLSTNNLTDAGLAALRVAPWFQHLESVDLSGNPAVGKMSRAA